MAQGSPDRIPVLAEDLGSRWLKFLGHPAIGNLLAFSALVVAISAALGLLQREVFWLVLSYVVLVAGRLAFAGLVRYQRRVLRETLDDRQRLLEEAQTTLVETAQLKRALAGAREDIAACEAGYAQLRGAVIRTAHKPDRDYDDFDQELADSLRSLAMETSAQQKRGRPVRVT